MYELNEFVNGMTVGFLAPRGYFRSQEFDKALDEISGIGINWVVLCVNQFQETYASTRIFPDNEKTVSDAELVHAIRAFRERNIKVMLKPMIEPLDSIWRGCISHYKGNIIAEVETDNIVKWFDSYRSMLKHYAQMAEETSCEMFCTGCELSGMEHHPAEWRKTIAMARSAYKGLITYNLTMNITEMCESREWMRDVDIVGVSGYFKVAPTTRSACLSEMIKGWAPHITKLETFSKWLGKPLLFVETGSRPVVGAAGITGDFWTESAVFSPREQADHYLSIQKALGHETWFYGSIWWKWDEHQHRPQYYLENGQYIGMEPVKETKDAMREWCGQNQPKKETVRVKQPIK
jgi:hypothetical protein